ncbi:alkene reductase [bacterium]|nr:alkene reductase [bacterium]
MKKLFTEYQLGKITLKNRMVMAPLTRGRANPDATPNSLMAEYYAQRASAGLIITEATAIDPMGYGWVNAPGIFSKNHLVGWKSVTQVVHNQGGKIFLQLWHMGRVSHPDFLGGKLPLAPSAIKVSFSTNTPLGKKEYVTPRALETEEIPEIVNQYVRAGEMAMQAGFDGVEIHAANGYLPDQFLRDGSNQRTDIYGGSIENRTRFLLEVVEGLNHAIGSDRVGVRISPRNPFNGMSDSDPLNLFCFVAAELSRRGILYLHSMEPLEGHRFSADGARVSPALKTKFQGTFIINGNLTCDSGEALLESNQADLIAYGVAFLANPDLVERFKKNAPLNEPEMATFYGGGAKGYIDYPTL